MKKVLFSLLLAILSVAGMAQSTKDVVKLKNGSVIKGTIIEMIPNQSIKLSTSDGSVFVYSMEEIQEVLKEEVNEKTSSNTNGDICSKAQMDALANYHGEGSLRGATWATTLITTPILGIIPAAIGASTEPNQMQINCPEPKLYQTDSEYRNCYNQQAKKIKSVKAWSALAASSCVWLGIIVIAALL